MISKDEILLKLKEIKPTYEKEGLILLGLFGSYAKGKETKYSDIDIAYKLDYKKFNQRYVGGFSKLLRINSIKDDLQNIFHKKIDFISNANKIILKDLIYV